MFGYVRTDVPNLYVKDTVLYRSIYCGLCKSIGKTCGQRARFALTYDLAFLSCFYHNLTDTDVVIKRQRCILHWFVKREIALVDALSERLACLNAILTYYKLCDDITDEGGIGLKKGFFTKAYKRAKKKEPVLEEIVKRNCKALLEYEKKKEGSIDISADFFGNMVKEITVEILGDRNTPATEEIGYNMGKWIYLIDALDDFDKDKKKGSYNPFVLTYQDAQSKIELLQKHPQEIAFVFGTVLSEIERLSGELKYCFNHDLLDNVFKRGLKVKTKQIMENNKKCVKTTKF